MVIKGGMRTMPIVAMEPRQEVFGAVRRVVINGGVGPLAEGSLDEAFGLTVGFRGVRLGEEVSDMEVAQSGGEGARAISGAVVSHKALNLDTEGREVRESIA